MLLAPHHFARLAACLLPHLGCSFQLPCYWQTKSTHPIPSRTAQTVQLTVPHSFLIQSLRLNYIRHVLPNHAAQSSLPGTGPYNLITFDASHSPYLILSGLADETKWPELRSGRSSPPLALGHGRAEGSGTGSARRRGVGGGGLKYSETIVGKAGGGGGAGMRVVGKERSWKGKGLVGLAAGVSLGAAVGGEIAASEGEAIG
jgi:hypothetical protein